MSTKGNSHVIDITPEVERELGAGGIRNGIVTVCVVGSTASISTTEYEPGLAETDLEEA
ncbi:MAG: YjbQ family protein [Planctomycetota bacterium]